MKINNSVSRCSILQSNIWDKPLLKQKFKYYPFLKGCMKQINTKLVLITLLLMTMILLTSCGTQDIYLCKDGSLAGDQQITSSKVLFHCPDGKLTMNYDYCKFEAPLKITQKVAEKKAKSFVDGYAQASGWSSKLVTTYAENGVWYSQMILSKRGETPFETLVLVNGTNGLTSCESNCDYQD